MKALNVPIHDTPVGLVACLPVAVTLADRVARTWAEPGDVLGVVTECKGVMQATDDDVRFAQYVCPYCNGTGYAPIKFVKVLAVWPLRSHHPASHRVAEYVLVLPGGQVQFWTDDTAHHGTVADLPDAVPGGVALHVEGTGCPTCDGYRVTQANIEGVWMAVICPTCQTPHTVEGDGPIVEVAP